MRTETWALQSIPVSRRRLLSSQTMLGEMARKARQPSDRSPRQCRYSVISAATWMLHSATWWVSNQTKHQVGPQHSVRLLDYVYFEFQ